MGLFLIIGSVQATGALEVLAAQVVNISGGVVTTLVPLLTGFSAVASSIVDNIPVAATLIPIVQNISGGDIPQEPLWWSLVLGCNLGGNGTPIGSISCVIAVLHPQEGSPCDGWLGRVHQAGRYYHAAADRRCHRLPADPTVLRPVPGSPLLHRWIVDMFEPTRRNVDQDVETFTQMFKHAQVGEVAAVEPVHVRRVLLVLDGSTQDLLSIAFAAHCQRSFQCPATVLDARESETSNQLAESVAKQLAAESINKPSGDSFDQILDAIEATACDFIIVPCPYGRDLDTIGPDSTGTVIDVLLARSPVPLLVVRRPYEVVGAVFSHVLLMLIGENKAAAAAAAWASAFVSHSGRVQLVLILEEEFYENIRQLMQAVDPKVEITPESLSQALLKTHMRLHRGLQKSASNIGFRYELGVYREHESHALEDASPQPLVVLALERGDHASEGHVSDRIRRTGHPLLIVPSGHN